MGNKYMSDQAKENLEEKLNKILEHMRKNRDSFSPIGIKKQGYALAVKHLEEFMDVIYQEIGFYNENYKNQSKEIYVDLSEKYKTEKQKLSQKTVEKILKEIPTDEEMTNTEGKEIKRLREEKIKEILDRVSNTLEGRQESSSSLSEGDFIIVTENVNPEDDVLIGNTKECYYDVRKMLAKKGYYCSTIDYRKVDPEDSTMETRCIGSKISWNGYIKENE